jgi:hypothetical protein
MRTARAPGLALIAVGLLLGGLPALRWQQHRPPPAFGDPLATGALAVATGAVRLRPPGAASSVAARSGTAEVLSAPTVADDRPPAVTRPPAAVTRPATGASAAAPSTAPATVPIGEAGTAGGGRSPALAVPLAVASHDARLERVAGPRPIPVAVRIASLGVDAPVVPTSVEAGALLIPDDATTAAW